MTIQEILENAHYNLNQTNPFSNIVGLEQLNNAMNQIKSGSRLDDVYIDEDPITALPPKEQKEYE